MSLQQQLLDLGELFNFADLSTLTQNIPIEWVASPSGGDCPAIRCSGWCLAWFCFATSQSMK